MRKIIQGQHNMKEFNSTLKFKNYLVEKIDFDVNYNYSGKDDGIVFDLDSDYFVENNNFILNLEAIIFPDAKKNDYPFSMKVKIAGIFEVDMECDIKTKSDFIEKNSIAILFPYLRSIITTVSSNANIPALILPPINVVSYLEEKRKVTK